MTNRIFKRLATLIFTALLILCTLPTVLGAESENGPVITLQPQSPTYPNYSIAVYTVKAEGSNLRATWYMEWLGSTYNISNTSGAAKPWEVFAGELYGPRKVDNNTFTYVFEGIETDLDGAYIWCVIKDGQNEVTSQKVRVSIGNPMDPPEILDIPSSITVEQGDEAEIRCVAKSPDESQLTFLWYETPTGKVQDIFAVNNGEEISDTLICDTSSLGTKYYICLVQTADGGMAYSSAVTVTVVKKTVVSTEEASSGTSQSTEQSTVQEPVSSSSTEEQDGENGKYDVLFIVLGVVLGAAAGAIASLLVLKKKK